MTEIMDRITALQAKEQAPNPDCRNPDAGCKWAVGIVSCWQCAHVKNGGSIEGLYTHLQERAPKVAPVKKERAAKVKPERAGKRGEAITTGDPKYDMYLKALPKSLHPV